MKWSKRQRELDALRRKHGRCFGKTIAIPNYKVADKHPSLGDGFAPIHHRAATGAHHPDAQDFPVGNLHKQGPVLITPGDIAGGQLKFFGGGKPNHSNLKD